LATSNTVGFSAQSYRFGMLDILARTKHACGGPCCLSTLLSPSGSDRLLWTTQSLRLSTWTLQRDRLHFRHMLYIFKTSSGQLALRSLSRPQCLNTFTSCLVCFHIFTMAFFGDLSQVSEMEVKYAEAGRRHLVAYAPVQYIAAAYSFHLGLCSSHRRQRIEFTRPRVRIGVQAGVRTTTSHGDLV